MTTKIRIKLPVGIKKQSKRKPSISQTLLDKYSNIKDITEQEKQLLKEYARVSEHKDKRKDFVTEKLNHIALSSPRASASSPGYRAVKSHAYGKFQQHKKPKYESRKLFVKNFQSRSSLESAFQSFGVESISIIENKNMAFVTLKNDLDVNPAIQSVNGKQAMFVERARVKERK